MFLFAVQTENISLFIFSAKSLFNSRKWMYEHDFLTLISTFFLYKEIYF